MSCCECHIMHEEENASFLDSIATDSSGNRRLLQPGTNNLDTTTLVVNCDGACPGNGQEPEHSTFGVYFGPNSPFNSKGHIPTTIHKSGNSGELFAIHRALAAVYTHFRGQGLQKLIIATDSQYVINCFTIWKNKWISNGWKTKKKTELVNKAVIWDADCLKCALHGMHGISVYFWKVSREENKEADRLAKDAVRGNEVAEWVTHYDICDDV